MKKSVPFIASCAILLSLLSCKSTEAAGPDSYNDDSGMTEIQVEKKERTSRSVSTDPYNQKKMNANRTFGEKLVNINKFSIIEPFSVYLKPMVGKISARKGNLIYREGTDVAGFELYYDSSAYAIQFDTKARHLLTSAVEQYFNDFDEKKLDRKNTKAKKIYGFCDAYMDYGLVSGMMMYYAKPQVSFGYDFVDGNPYFTLYLPPADNLAVNTKTEEGALKAKTVVQTYYFTKSQAKKLCTFLSDESVGAMQMASSYDETVDNQDTYSE